MPLLSVEALKKPELNSRQMLGLKVLPYIPMWVWRITERLFLRTPISKNFMTTSRKISTDILHRELEAAEGQLPQGKDVLSVLGELPHNFHSESIKLTNDM